MEEQHTQIFEVLISDDSSDNTPSLVHNFAQHSLLDIQLFHHDTRRGAAAAWNEILQRAAGDIIVLYDADTVPHPSNLHRTFKEILESAHQTLSRYRQQA
jgi:glycosyltransferase involved in cell wall biosynthesis